MLIDAPPIKLIAKIFCADCDKPLYGEVHLTDDILYVHVFTCPYCINKARDAGVTE